jgi:hypothetical protein
MRRTALFCHRAPTICFLLKDHLGGHRLQGNDDVKTFAIRRLQLQEMDSYQQEIGKLVVRYDRYHNHGGDYVKSKVAVVNMHVYCFC